MRDAGGGSIINFGSISWHTFSGGMPAYTTAKAAVEGLTKGMARDLGADNIRVNCVLPGSTITGFHIKRRAERDGISYEEAEARIRAEGSSRAPMKRQADPIEIAYGILFLASDEASYITGAHLRIDGGLGRRGELGRG